MPPDIEVEQWPAEVATPASDPQLEKAIEIVMEALESDASPPTERPPFPVRVPQ